MDISMINAAVAGVVGLIAGAIGSLVAPWVQWGIEQKRLRNSRRIELISQWREIISNRAFNRGNLLNNPLYGPLRELLEEKVRQEIERPSNQITIVLDSPTNSHDRDLLLREIARIEKAWKLI